MRHVSRFTERRADLFEAGIEAQVEADEDVGPKRGAQLLARDHLSGPRGQQREDTARLRPYAYSAAVTPEFEGMRIELERAE
jgi:hypothetical protein